MYLLLQNIFSERLILDLHFGIMKIYMANRFKPHRGLDTGHTLFYFCLDEITKLNVVE